ncbi:hypothetical protein GCM10022206_08310 [Streptomyces chiangmaiensis]
MQKSTGPVPSPPCRVSVAIEGLCAPVPQNSEVTLSPMEPPYEAGPVGTAGPSSAGPRGGARATRSYGHGRGGVQLVCDRCEFRGGPPPVTGHPPNVWMVVVRYVRPGPS